MCSNIFKRKNCIKVIVERRRFNDRTKLKDPRKLFYSDGFPQQDQETPALQDKMVPKPDCGEDSYVGNHKLENRRVLITGGDSGIGRAAAIAFAREGADIALHFPR